MSIFQNVIIRIEPDQIMSHGRSTDPCASVTIYSVGSLVGKKSDHAESIASFVSATLVVPRDRYCNSKNEMTYTI